MRPVLHFDAIDHAPHFSAPIFTRSSIVADPFLTDLSAAERKACDAIMADMGRRTEELIMQPFRTNNYSENPAAIPTLGDLKEALRLMSEEAKREPLAVGFACSFAFEAKFSRMSVPRSGHALESFTGLAVIIDPRMTSDTTADVFYCRKAMAERIKEIEEYLAALKAEHTPTEPSTTP